MGHTYTRSTAIGREKIDNDAVQKRKNAKINTGLKIFPSDTA
jgi:hypothetical protein